MYLRWLVRVSGMSLAEMAGEKERMKGGEKNEYIPKCECFVKTRGWWSLGCPEKLWCWDL